MKPSSLRMRAISVLSLEAGTSTFGWRAWIAFRTRVSMSAMGSLVIKLLGIRELKNPRIQESSVGRNGRAILEFSNSGVLEFFFHLPARLRHTRDLAVQRELPEAQTANSELAQKRARAAAAPAAVAVTGRVLRHAGLTLRL